MSNEIAKLQSLIANNHNLDRLEAILNEFNSFKILNIADHEIRHSNILKWLLDPKGNHNIGDMFLKKFLSEAIISNENIDTTLNVFDIQIIKDFISDVVKYAFADELFEEKEVSRRTFNGNETYIWHKYKGEQE